MPAQPPQFNAICLGQLLSTHAKPLSGLMQALTTAADVDQLVQRSFVGLSLDSRQLQANEVFVLLASQGITDVQHGFAKARQYAQQVSDKAAFILTEIEPSALALPADFGLPVLYVPKLRNELGDLMQAYLQYQQAVILPEVAAVTGTNGKTTISQLLAQLCQGSGRDSAIMGTAGNGRLQALTQASHTTSDVLTAQRFLYDMGRQGVRILALEASSHGLHQQRLQAMPVRVAIYSNLSRDHLDYHSDMADYAAAKSLLFNRQQFPELTHAIVNIDDAYAAQILAVAADSGIEVWTYSLRSDSGATFVARDIQPSLSGTQIELVSDFATLWLESPLLGRFNVANLLAACAAAVALGVDMAALPKLVAQLKGACGRMQRIDSTTGCFIVDYAHTPDALTQVLNSLKPHCAGKLWAVFGCGGDRDKGKRPLMTQAGLVVADRVILTADNPRSEDPLAILADMQVGISDEQRQRTDIEPDRRTAITHAVAQAGLDDIVVIAGKGHESYQEIHGVRYDFDDALIVQQALTQARRS